MVSGMEIIVIVEFSNRKLYIPDGEWDGLLLFRPTATAVVLG